MNRKVLKLKHEEVSNIKMLKIHFEVSNILQGQINMNQFRDLLRQLWICMFWNGTISSISMTLNRAWTWAEEKGQNVSEDRGHLPKNNCIIFFRIQLHIFHWRSWSTRGPSTFEAKVEWELAILLETYHGDASVPGTLRAVLRDRN